jgi:hypothetical protein
MPLTDAQAVDKIEKAYRAYLKRKATLVAVPSQYPPVAGNFLRSRLQEEDKFYKSLAGSAAFIATLHKGNYRLLEYYLQHGKDISPFLYDAFFCKNSISVDMLDAVSDVKHVADELTRSAVPGNKVRVFPLVTATEKFSDASLEHLIPFLKKVYPLQDEEIPLLEQRFAGIPNGERFFATVDLDDYFLLCALKIVLQRMFRQISDRNQDAMHGTIYKYKNLLSMPELPAAPLFTKIANSVTRLKVDLFTFTIPMHEMEAMLLDAYNQLVSTYPFLQKINWKTSIYLQIIYANVALCAHIPSPNQRGVAQVVLPPKVMEICHEIVYGKNNHVGRLTGFGIFTPKCIVEATHSHHRIINIYSKHVKFIATAHESVVGPASLRLHDLNHWVRMYAMPEPIRSGLVSWSRMLEATTGIECGKLSYALNDMDMSGYENMHINNNARRSLNVNIFKIKHYYSGIIHGYRDLRRQLLDYHLILVYGMIKDPNWMKQTFAHCSNDNPQAYLTVFLQHLSEAFKLSPIDHAEIILSYRANYSITENVFHYYIWDAIIKDKVSLQLIEIMSHHILPAVNIFKWQRNNGLAIQAGNLTFMARDITDDLALQLIEIILNSASRAVKASLVASIENVIDHCELKTTNEIKFAIALKKLLPAPTGCMKFLTALGVFKTNNATIKAAMALQSGNEATMRLVQ